MSAEPEGFVGVDRAAEFLDRKKSWVYEQVRLGKMPSYKLGVFRVFKLSELEAWVTGRGGNGADGNSHEPEQAT